MITGRISFVKFVAYFASEILGAMLGVACVRGTSPSSERNNMVIDIQHGESMARAFFLEFFLSSIMCFVYHITFHEKNHPMFLVAIPNGFAYFACHLITVLIVSAKLLTLRFVSSRPLCGGVSAAALHIPLRYFGFGRHSAGIDAEDHEQYARARAAYKGEQSSGDH
ncbi:hypothetical protein BGZ80_009835 [Entomortierella chlamydospora]|uniref:Aquaporin n=1 Tax=Entomortierella chlamydospora TaxID=101097 RepID=A0A9P6T0G3_9FUNG|nr:hypothetical protein BGZ80_009835 [Entomortierella chlamydospora]